MSAVFPSHTLLVADYAAYLIHELLVGGFTDVFHIAPDVVGIGAAEECCGNARIETCGELHGQFFYWVLLCVAIFGSLAASVLERLWCRMPIGSATLR